MRENYQSPDRTGRGVLYALASHEKRSPAGAAPRRARVPGISSRPCFQCHVYTLHHCYRSAHDARVSLSLSAITITYFSTSYHDSPRIIRTVVRGDSRSLTPEPSSARIANILASQRHWAMVYNPTPARGLSQALVKTRRLQPQLSVSLRTHCGLIAD